MAWFDNLHPDYYLAEESGALVYNSINIPPHNILLPLSDVFVSTVPHYDPAYSLPLQGAYKTPTLFKPQYPSGVTKFRQIKIVSDAQADILLVTPSGSVLGLYSSVYGDVPAATNTWADDAWGTRFWTITWTLTSGTYDALEIAYFIVGRGGGGYPSSIPRIITALEMDIQLEQGVRPFWTKFKGQTEVV